MTTSMESGPWQALPASVADVIEPELDAITEEIMATIAREVPEYARPFEGSFGRGVRTGVTEALRQFLALIRSPSGARGPGREVYVALGRGELRQGRTLDSLQSAYRVGARVAWRRVAEAARRAGLDPETISLLAESIFAYIEEISADSVEGYTEAQSRLEDERRRRRRELVALLPPGRAGDSPVRRRQWRVRRRFWTAWPRGCRRTRWPPGSTEWDAWWCRTPRDRVGRPRSSGRWRALRPLLRWPSVRPGRSASCPHRGRSPAPLCVPSRPARSPRTAASSGPTTPSATSSSSRSAPWSSESRRAVWRRCASSPRRRVRAWRRRRSPTYGSAATPPPWPAPSASTPRRRATDSPGCASCWERNSTTPTPASSSSWRCVAARPVRSGPAPHARCRPTPAPPAPAPLLSRIACTRAPWAGAGSSPWS